MIINGIDIGDDEELSLEDKEAVEKLLSELADVQVRASFYYSDFAKGQRELSPETITHEEVEDINDISNEFNRISDELASKLNNNSIRKTIKKLEESNIDSPALVPLYLNQLMREMNGLSEKSKAIIDAKEIRKQLLQKIEKNQEKENARKKQEKILEEEAKKEEAIKLQEELLQKQNAEKQNDNSK